MAKYKRVVKEVVKERVDRGMEVKEWESWKRFGEGRVDESVEVIDEKVVELREGVLVER